MTPAEKKAADLAARAAANQGAKTETGEQVTQGPFAEGPDSYEARSYRDKPQGEPIDATVEYHSTRRNAMAIDQTTAAVIDEESVNDARELRSLQLAAARADLRLKERQLEILQNPVAAATAAQDDEDRELKEMQKQTAKYELDAARERHAQFEEDKATKIRKRKSALNAMEANRKTQENIQKLCKHRVGGFGLADQYRGGMNAQTSMIKCLLPIAGMVFIYCTRCKAESTTPDRKLAIDNPEEYTRLLDRHLEFEELFANSYNSQPMGGPQFQFEKDGIPFRPSLV